MSLTKDALDTITATAIAASGVPLNTHVPAILVPKGYELTDTEHLQAHPSRFRGEFSTHSIPAFAEYVNRHAITGQSVGFIHQATMLARVIFDLGDSQYPLFGEHTATLGLLKTPEYLALHEAIGHTWDQTELTDFIEDWAPHITAIGDVGNENIPLPAAISAIQRMRIETSAVRESGVGDFSAKKSAMEEIEAKSQGQLPRFLEFACTPHEHLAPINIRLRISVLTTGKAPAFRLRWLHQGAQLDAIARDFREALTDTLDGTVPLTEGTFTH